MFDAGGVVGAGAGPGGGSAAAAGAGPGGGSAAGDGTGAGTLISPVFTVQSEVIIGFFTSLERIFLFFLFAGETSSGSTSSSGDDLMNSIIMAFVSVPFINSST